MTPVALYYICHIDNLASILEKGVYSREQVKQHLPGAHQSIHDQGIVERRQHKETPAKRSLHNYVNLFFQARNAMMYRLIHNRDKKTLAILQINPAVLEQDGVFFTDRNAATWKARFYQGTEELQKLDDTVFKKIYWGNQDDSKERMMAEVLVPDRIDAHNIMSIYTCCAEKNPQIAQLAQQKSVEWCVDSHMFFSPQKRRRIADTNISLIQGDMFFSEMQTFAISVNLQGVMGKGLAARTKYQFPDAYVRYQDDCKSRKLKAGKPTLYKRGVRIEEELADEPSLLDKSKLNGNRWFLFFPTKRHWRDNSRIEDIEASMQWLLKNYQKQEIKSIAMPALGCGLGKLHWRDVGPVMCRYLVQMDIYSCIYLPMEGQLDENTLNEKFLLGAAHPNPQ